MELEAMNTMQIPSLSLYSDRIFSKMRQLCKVISSEYIGTSYKFDADLEKEKQSAQLDIQDNLLQGEKIS